jgi:hypothetical protein
MTGTLKEASTGERSAFDPMVIATGFDDRTE